MDTTKLLTELDAIAKRIENLRRSLVKQQPQLPATVQAKVDAKLCVYCGDPLGKKRSTRGAHEKCYRTAMRRIEKAQTTDEELVAEGLLLPQERQGRKPAKNDPVLELRRQDSERAATGLSTAANPSVSKTSKTK